MLDGIGKSLKKGEEVRLVGFGTFSVRERAAGKGRNPGDRQGDQDRRLEERPLQGRRGAEGEPQQEGGQEVARLGRTGLRRQSMALLQGRPSAASLRSGLAARLMIPRGLGARAPSLYAAGLAGSGVARQCGRLAQLVEHLVYTERVGGSSPSPPTSARFLRGVVAGAALALMATSSAWADEGGDAMSFHLAPLASRDCGRNCPDVIVADGVIEAETPKAFVDFLRSGSSDKKLRRVMFFNSRGGNVVASMVFGHLLRQLRIAGVVGRFDDSADPGPYVGQCLSACVYALMGAIRRVAPPGSEVGLHRMSIVETEGGGWFGGSHTTRSFADPPMVAVLGRYAKRMGVDPAVVRTAESLPPDTVHLMSRDEMRRWSLAKSQF